MSKSPFAVVFSLMVVFIFLITDIHSQSIESKVPARIHVLMEGSDNFKEFGYSILESLQKAFTEQNLLTEEDTTSSMNVSYFIREIDSSRAAVSVIIQQEMPKEVINLGAKAELLYSNLSQEKRSQMPEEGKFIREYASAEYLKQFNMLWDHLLEIVTKDNINEFSGKIVEKFKSADK